VLVMVKMWDVFTSCFRAAACFAESVRLTTTRFGCQCDGA
jgi:hypothetical protein